jgi:Flp pilus assembly protein TadB
MSGFFIFTLIATAILLLGKNGNNRVKNIDQAKLNLKNFKFNKKIPEIPADWLDELAANLQSGAPARIALKNSIEKYSLINTNNACTDGSSVSKALLLDRPDDEVTKALSSCWDIAEDAGIGLASAIGQLAKGMQLKLQLEQELNSALTQSRLSVWVLAALPLFGLLLAGAVAGNPLVWLLTSKFGLAVLFFGLMLELLGIFWIMRINNQVKRHL